MRSNGLISRNSGGNFRMYALKSLLLIAGSSQYPFLVVRFSREAGVKRVVLVALKGKLLRDLTSNYVHVIQIGQLSRLLSIAMESNAHHAMTVGQIAPRNLFSFRPDMRIFSPCSSPYTRCRNFV